MRVPHFLYVRHEFFRKIAVRVNVSVLVPFPGEQVDLVDIYGGFIDVFAL